MSLRHLHLGARDVAVTRRFYETFLGFRFHFAIHEDFIFLTNDDRFLLAISKEAPATFPPWFHVGFFQPSPGSVRALRQRLLAGGVAVDELIDKPARVAFGVTDPDGLGIEIFWEGSDAPEAAGTTR